MTQSTIPTVSSESLLTPITPTLEQDRVSTPRPPTALALYLRALLVRNAWIGLFLERFIVALLILGLFVWGFYYALTTYPKVVAGVIALAGVYAFFGVASPKRKK